MELQCFIKMESYIVYSFVFASSTPYNDYDIHSHCFHWSLVFLYSYMSLHCRLRPLFIHYSLVDIRIVPNSWLLHINFLVPAFGFLLLFFLFKYLGVELLCHKVTISSLMAQRVKRLSAMQETRVRSLGWEDPLEKEMAAHSSILACKVPWTTEPCRLSSMGSQESDTTERLHFTMWL